MIDLKPGTTGSVISLAASTEAAGLDDVAVMRLLTLEDAESVAQLETWLKNHARTFAPVVTRAIQEGPGLSPEAARAVIDALVWRAPTDGETTLRLLEACLDVIAARLTESLGSGAPGAIGDRDDTLVGSAVAVLTSSRPSRHSETAITLLAEAGPGGALVLARAFDAVRSALKVCIVRHLMPADVLELGDNVVASLARSVSRLAEDLESPASDVATRFLADLGSVRRMEPSEIGITEPLEMGDRDDHESIRRHEVDHLIRWERIVGLTAGEVRSRCGAGHPPKGKVLRFPP